MRHHCSSPKLFWDLLSYLEISATVGIILFFKDFVADEKSASLKASTSSKKLDAASKSFSSGCEENESDHTRDDEAARDSVVGLLRWNQCSLNTEAFAIRWKPGWTQPDPGGTNNSEGRYWSWIPTWGSIWLMEAPKGVDSLQKCEQKYSPIFGSS